MIDNDDGIEDYLLTDVHNNLWRNKKKWCYSDNDNHHQTSNFLHVFTLLPRWVLFTFFTCWNTWKLSEISFLRFSTNIKKLIAIIAVAKKKWKWKRKKNWRRGKSNLKLFQWKSAVFTASCWKLHSHGNFQFTLHYAFVELIPLYNHHL
jgi:hypothetical protein